MKKIYKKKHKKKYVVFKTRIKRSELIFNIIILALFAVVASTQLLSAYGAMCVAWDPSYWGLHVPVTPGSAFTLPPFNLTPMVDSVTVMFPYMVTFGVLMQVFNVFTWIMAFAWGFLIYLYFTKYPWKRIFLAGIIISVIGFLTGLIPALIADTNGFLNTEWSVMAQTFVAAEFEIGSPHWGRTYGNLIMVFVFLAMNFVPRLNVAAKKFVEERNIAGQYVKQLILMAMFFFWLGAASFLGTSFMADAHVVGGINVWEMIEIQFIGGVVTSLIGASMLTTALVYSQIRPSSALITTK